MYVHDYTISESVSKRGITKMGYFAVFINTLCSQLPNHFILAATRVDSMRL